MKTKKMKTRYIILFSFVLITTGGCLTYFHEESLLDKVKRTKSICLVEFYPSEDEGNVSFTNLCVVACGSDEVEKFVDNISHGAPAHEISFCDYLATLVLLDELRKPLAIISIVPHGRVVTLNYCKGAGPNYKVPVSRLMEAQTVSSEEILCWTYEKLMKIDSAYLEKMRKYYEGLGLNLEKLIFGFNTYAEYLASTNSVTTSGNVLIGPDKMKYGGHQGQSQK